MFSFFENEKIYIKRIKGNKMSDLQTNQNYYFNDNNWIKNTDHISLRILNKNGISMYIDNKGDINYRLSPNEQYISTKNFRSLENILLNITGTHFDLSDFYTKRKSSDE